ncbi:hypothetical protein HQ571_05440 [Candidatus Kuenenbacteria bacterium]|nr:hypothetical protein [Candidatus Kuenenbacteria bacterium]
MSGNGVIPPDKSPVIELPVDDLKVRELQAKRDDYLERLKTHKSEQYRLDLTYRIELIESLLREKRVETWDFCHLIVTREGSINGQAFDNACAVVDDYCKTGGAQTIRGRGFGKFKLTQENFQRFLGGQVLADYDDNIFLAHIMTVEVDGDWLRMTFGWVVRQEEDGWVEVEDSDLCAEWYLREVMKVGSLVGERVCLTNLSEEMYTFIPPGPDCIEWTIQRKAERMH